MFFFRQEPRYVLDSSSIIDGRVVQLFEKKFLEGRIMIPHLVRTIVKKMLGPEADKRFSMLKRSAQLEFAERNIDGLSEEVWVLKIATRRKAKVITASDELSRHAKSYPEVRIINLRELYRALTPIFNPNTIISVKLLKRGLNPNEAVGYIDGVKVVVEDGAKLLNQTINLRVTSMVSTETGNVVFGELADKSPNIHQEKPVAEEDYKAGEDGIS